MAEGLGTRRVGMAWSARREEFERLTLPLRRRLSYGDEVVWLEGEGERLERGQVVGPDRGKGYEVEAVDGTRRRWFVDKGDLRMPKGGRRTRESSESLARRARVAALVSVGDVCKVDMGAARNLMGPGTPARHQFRILNDVVRQGGGYVDVDGVSGRWAEVSAHGNPGSKLMGGVNCPVGALRSERKGEGPEGWEASSRCARVAARMTADARANLEVLGRAAEEAKRVPGVEGATLWDSSWDGREGTIDVELPVMEWSEPEHPGSQELPKMLGADPRTVARRVSERLRAMGLKVMSVRLPEAVRGLFGKAKGWDMASVRLELGVPA